MYPLRYKSRVGCLIPVVKPELREIAALKREFALTQNPAYSACVKNVKCKAKNAKFY